MKVGVLALQGDVQEHLDALKELGVQAVAIRRPYEVEVMDGLIIPGGESTTLGLFLHESGLDSAIQKRAKEGMPVWGTCMGAILLSKEIFDNSKKQKTLELMNIKVRRNAYGRQRESFEEEISIPSLQCDTFPGVFIRAPWIEEVGPKVETLATYQGKPVLAREANLLASSFHPEIGKSRRIHQYFLEMIKERGLSN